MPKTTKFISIGYKKNPYKIFVRGEKVIPSGHNLWNDPKVKEIKKDISNKEKFVQPFFIQHKELKRRGHTVLQHNDTKIQIIKKGINPENREALSCLIEKESWSIVPSFLSANDPEQYYELNLIPFGYIALRECIPANLKREVKTILQNEENLISYINNMNLNYRRNILDIAFPGLSDPLAAAVKNSFYHPNKKYMHNHLHYGNILINKSRNNEIRDIKIIDFKYIELKDLG